MILIFAFCWKFCAITFRCFRFLFIQYCTCTRKVISPIQWLTMTRYFIESCLIIRQKKGIWDYDGGVESFLNPKLTNRRKSEKTSRRGFSVRFSPAPVPVGGPLPNIPSLIEPPRGRIIRLAPGLTRLPPAWPVADGSISREDRKDVLWRSVFVLVIVRKESSRLFCTDFGVPFKSRIWNQKKQNY